ncbi:proteasome assembly chaperone family protein [Saccharomonospora saliphila]|uniref:proteasome assembly chaperone family protein n=1 Tax=Saccharomonospora saliphila TaxID=369829 RepID=UPI00039B3FD2|nr:PAC2 family protein [Saccharomonospora saliphila]
MRRDPERLYDLDSGVPVPEGAVLLYHLDGFVDAGSAGEVLAEHLRAEFDSEVVARFDVDRLIDYRSRRPVMTYSADHWADYDAPELVVRLFHDADGTPFLLLTGPEPDHEWELFSEAVRGLVERWRVRLSVNFHGIPMGVPHTRPLGVTAHATRAELVRGYRAMFTQVQIPGSAAALVEYRLGQSGHDAAGFAAHVPHYLAQSRYPAAALTLLDALSEATGLRVSSDEVRESALRADEEVERQVRDNDEVAEVVAALERQYDTFSETGPEDNLLADVDEMPTADELASQFEKFLSEQRRDQGES